jgi:hypothetical protein
MEGKEKVPMNGWLNLKSSRRCITIQKALDESIQSLNSDYEAKRYNNMTLNPLINVRKNLFYDWLKTTTSWVGNIKFKIIQPKRLFRAVEKHAVGNCIKLEKLKIPLYLDYTFILVLADRTECVVALEEFVKFWKKQTQEKPEKAFTR